MTIRVVDGFRTIGDGTFDRDAGWHDEEQMTDVVRTVRAAINDQGVDALVVDDLTEEDLDKLSWAGSPTHIRYVRDALRRVSSGEVEYLVVRSPSGQPVAKGGIDYDKRENAGEIWQMATHGELQGLGLGTNLIRAAEERIRRRGLRYATLGVEDDNLRARRLYERLGYEAYGSEQTSWEQKDAEGNTYLHETEVTVLRKDLGLKPRR